MSYNYWMIKEGYRELTRALHDFHSLHSDLSHLTNGNRIYSTFTNMYVSTVTIIPTFLNLNFFV